MNADRGRASVWDASARRYIGWGSYTADVGDGGSFKLESMWEGIMTDADGADSWETADQLDHLPRIDESIVQEGAPEDERVSIRSSE